MNLQLAKRFEASIEHQPESVSVYLFKINPVVAKASKPQVNHPIDRNLKRFVV